MKIIDLFNDIANNKEVPKRIKYQDKIYKYDEIYHEYYYEESKNCRKVFSRTVTFYNDDLKNGLNDEVEIIEDKPKFEIDSNGYIHTLNGSWKARKMDIEFAKAVNYLLEKSDSNG